MRVTLMTACLLALVGSASASQHQHFEAPRLNLTEHQALTVATRTASREGHDLAAVQLQASETELIEQQWTFVFHCKKSKPHVDCGFAARVDRQTGVTTLMAAP